VPIIVAALFGIVALIWQLVGQVVQVLTRPIIQHLNAADPDVPLSPADAADAVERSILDFDRASGEAASAGVSAEVFQWMVELTGEPPGIEQMLSLWRRGKLDEGVLDQMIAYSRIKTEWSDFVRELAHDTMTGADAIEATLKGVIGESEGRDLFGQAGGLDDQWPTLLATAGNPIGVEQANTLYNHGLITAAQLRSVILHSRINPTFEPMAELLRHHYLAPFQIATALKAGTVTAAEATSWLLADGYPADQVAATVKGGSAEKTATHKSLTEAQITEAYDSGILSEAEAGKQLQDMGYEAGEVEWILALYNAKRRLAAAQSAITVVRKQYLAKRITEAEAMSEMVALDVDPVAREAYLAVWTVEQREELKELTAAQLGAIYKKGGLSDEQLRSRYESMGYSQADADLLLFNYGGPAPAGSPASMDGG
jgi:hypothetical protein